MHQVMKLVFHILEEVRAPLPDNHAENIIDRVNTLHEQYNSITSNDDNGQGNDSHSGDHSHSSDQLQATKLLVPHVTL